jgi:putative nucleotidyltransferase with HDIG domain
VYSVVGMDMTRAARRQGPTVRHRHPSAPRRPVSSPDPEAPKRWRERMWFANGVRVVVVAVPLVVSFLVALALSHTLPAPEPFAQRLVRWLGIAAVSTGVLIGLQHLARRLLPLAALLSLTLVFPDTAPSRFRLALRGASARDLDRALNDITARRAGLVRPSGDTQHAAEELLVLVAALSRHDRLTRGHSERVRAYAVMIGEEMGLDTGDLDRLRWAALLHDVGKMSVPAEILNKPGRLTDEEFAVVREHTTFGAELTDGLHAWLGDAVRAVDQHHERWSGGGYPYGLRGTQIVPAARIVAVADAFDVMTSSRSYKQPMAATDARAELERCAGSQFDPAVVRAMLSISLGRLWRAMGPWSVLAQLRLFPQRAAHGGVAVVSATAATVGLVFAGFTGVIAHQTQTVVDDVSAWSAAVSAQPAAGSDGDEPASSPVGPGASAGSASPSDPQTAASTATSPGTEPPVATASIPSAPAPTPAPTPGGPGATPGGVTVTTGPTGASTARTTTVPVVTSSASSTTSTTVARGTPTTTRSTPATTVAVPTTTVATAATTSTSTSTSTTSTTTSTTLPAWFDRPVVFMLAAGDATDEPHPTVLDLVALRPVQHAVLPNYDADRNPDPGLTVARSLPVLEAAETGATQSWRFPEEIDQLPPSASLTVWVAPAVGDAPSAPLKVRAAVFECDAPRVRCTRIIRDTRDVSTEPGSFARVDFDLSTGRPVTVRPGRRFEVRVAVLSTSSGDAWIAYDVTGMPSQLRLGP